MTRRLLVLGIVTALAGSAAADVQTATFGGWSKNGTYWGDTTSLCASKGYDKVVWNLPQPEADGYSDACNDEKGAEVDKARADLVLPPALKSLPAGMKLKVDKNPEGGARTEFTLSGKGGR